jgi:lipoic acid synthetase
VFNHNIETVREVFKTARPQGNYDTSLEVLKYVKENSNILTKSGLMIGLGETFEQIEQTFVDLKNVGCDILTVGQYIQPSKEHLEVSKYYTLDEYEKLKELARKIGINHYQIGPLVRSSYKASDIANL